MHKKITKFKSLLTLLLVSTSLFLNGCSNTENPKQVTSKENIESESISNSQVSSLNNAEIHFIDTGNSDAILIKEGETFTLIDGGDNDDEASMVRYLNNQGVKNIKYLISTHAHADHLGGLDAVVKNFAVENAFVSNGSADSKSYRDFINALSDKGLSPSVPLENNKFFLENSYFEVLNTNGGSTTNEQSLVLLFTNKNDKILFTGDAEAGTEKEIMPKLCDIDLLKVGHHGSRSSSTDELLQKTTPEYAVIQVGKGNSYGHPHKETMDKLKRLGIEVHRNDECSDIIFISTGDGVSTNCKAGSYTPGKRESSNSDIQNNDQQINNQQSGQNDEIVYYTPKGKSYHSRRDCSALIRSKTILSGTIKESNKLDPCDRCYGK